MRVVVYCEKCTGVGEAHLHGAWDIKTVRHDCPVKPGMGLEEIERAKTRPTPIRFEYQPPRRVF